MLKGLCLLTFFVFPLLAQAQVAHQLVESYKHFKLGAYQEVISSLKNVRGTKKVLSTKYYLLGISHARLQQFEEANKSFQQAIKLGNRSDDLFYEYGQALYASNELEKSRKVFNRSRKANFKKESSLYYIGHISQILEQYRMAKKAYVRLSKSRGVSKNLKQIAKFQLGEVFLSLARKKDDTYDYVKKYVLPQMHRAVKVDEKSGLAEEIHNRISEIQREFGLDPNKYVNGRNIPQTKWRIYIDHEQQYDSNVTNRNDQSSTTDTKKDSFIYDTTLFASYRFDIARRFVVTPELRYNEIKYSERDEPTVYTNDSRTIQINDRNKWEHQLFNNPASFLFDIEYIHTSRDKNQIKERQYFGQSFTYTFGEKFKYFKFGDTTLRLKYKTYRAHSLDLENNTKSIALNQLYVRQNGHIIMFFHQTDMIDNFNANENSTDSHLFRLDYIIANLLPKMTFNFGLSYTLLNTKLQKPTRGTEKTLNPSLKITKNINKNFLFAIEYNYTKNSSLDDNYKYKKHLSALNLRYTF